ncbi:AMP-binding protein [Streptomyces sp. NPDC057257]|uniref:AMP-binding protein n=1 Tax=Streptomyces sp. NPDC057257 TaxID=3346071 RepID=UPI003642135D
MDLLTELQARYEDDTPLIEVLAADGGPPTVWTGRQIMSGAQLLAQEIRALSAELGRPARVGLLAENSAEWIVADLALLFAGAVEIPVPTAFTAQQAAALLAEADTCLTDAPGTHRLAEWGQALPVRELAAAPLVEAARETPFARTAPPATDAVIKTIHTSGTTSAPKGVRIRRKGLEALLTSLRERIDAPAFRRYLSIVPLSLLIEQVAGVYLPLLLGGRVVFLPPGTALVGTAADAAARMSPLLRAARPTAMVVPPTMAALLLARCDEEPNEDVEARYRRLFGHEDPVFVACGGAPVPADILHRLHTYGITVHEGYGLSENSSVVSWNVPGQVRFGTVGRPLGHVEVRLTTDHELLVRSPSLFAGYTGTDPSSLVVDDEGWLHTGDLAKIDADGYLRITGRRKNIVITAAGRNISPEWVEAQYRRLPFVREVVIVADGLDTARALVVIDRTVDREEARDQLKEFGRQRLSEVERPTVIHLMADDDDAYSTCFTVTGRPRRDRVRALLTEEAP